jgi:hypothetical protein
MVCKVCSADHGHSTEVFLLDGKASMDGIWKALGELSLCSEIGVTEAD